MPATKQASPAQFTEGEPRAEATESSEDAADEEAEAAGEPQTEEDMAYQVRCPLCSDTFDRPQALHGHLRFSHDLRDKELDEVYEKAQSEDHFDFYDEDEEEDAGEDAEELELTGSPSPSPTKDEEDGEAVARAFDWEARLESMSELRENLDRLDQSREPTSLESFFGKSGERDEGVQECLDALDEMEIEVRERLGMSTVDRELQRNVDRTLDKISQLVRCREQREALQERFSDREGTPDRIARLDEKEKEIRGHVRFLWDAGKPTEELDDEDPLSNNGEQDE